MQKWIASGRLIKDPEIRTLQSGKNLASFTIAVQRTIKNKETDRYDSDLFNCTAFGFSADFVGNYLTKGSKCLVEGRFQNESWEKDGQKHYATKVIVEHVEGCGDRKDSDHNTQNEEKGMESFGQATTFDESDIPF